MPEITNHSASSSASPQKRPILSKVEKRAQKFLKQVQKALKTSMNFMMKNSSDGSEDANNPEPTPELRITFENESVETEFRNLEAENSKLRELIDDIQYKPWSIEGTGRPEYLTGNLKGWMSRRLDHENRLVYKVVGPGQICILSCSGHYE